MKEVIAAVGMVVLLCYGLRYWNVGLLNRGSRLPDKLR